MELEKVKPSLWPRGLNPASTPRVRASSKFILLDDPKDTWSCLTSFSNFVSSQGKHGAYFLNERRQFKVFWARTVLENGEDPEVHLTTMPSFNNKRFEIQSELAFHVCSYFNGVMKYISDIRLEDPDYEANQLLVNTYSLCNTIEVRSQMLYIALHTPHPTHQCPTHQHPHPFSHPGKCCDCQGYTIRALWVLDTICVSKERFY